LAGLAALRGLDDVVGWWRDGHAAGGLHLFAECVGVGRQLVDGARLGVDGDHEEHHDCEQTAGEQHRDEG
jgi:hypothetical protein